ncbi:hypothetical protein AWB77_00760 [Caballeronia fortuita]|uniref:Uncharacterized protein n=1 Tax=Caballeronia fortuita TaxID=1777138 RepID=A0A157ZH22_9BURK|nr:hypothetical protein [Caballeronia fortuita]SAK44842.1 hypothetical protein AWB77_00760 [Caballeronia fortuita]
MTQPNAPQSSFASQSVFDEWPSGLRVRFDGTLAGDDDGFTASLCAADDAHRVRTALLSAGELFAPDARTLAFALWPSSRTARAVVASGRATLAFVFDAAFYQVHLNVRRVPLDGVPLACFVGAIESGEVQRVEYARLTSGIAFELTDAQPALARWREQIGWLKRAASAAA